LREKPTMSFEHNNALVELGYQLRSQLDPDLYVVRINVGRVRRLDETYYIPDVYVVPVGLTTALRGHPNILESYDAPLPLVSEIWSPSTGAYDVDQKLPEYKRRGDLEIWRLHPFEHTLTAWRRKPDGDYAEVVLHGGLVQPVALPNVTINLDALFV
jgi:Uma2 family endonuclease